MKTVLARRVGCAALLLLPAVAHADDEDKHNAVTSSITLGFTRSRIFDVRHDAVDARVGIGGTFGDGTTAFDWLGTVSLARGQTEAGRTTTSFGFLGTEGVIRYRFLRFGARLELASMMIERSTGGTESDLYARIEGLAGITFARTRDFSVFGDVRSHAAVWGDASINGFSLAVGVRL